MARPRKIPDAVVHDAVLALIRQGGDKAVTFQAVAERAGLAASSLAGRHGSVPAMIADARAGQWHQLDAQTDPVLADAPMAPKGALRILRALGELGPLPPVAAAPELALQWRARVEAALAMRLGGGDKGRQSARILFGYWQGAQGWAEVLEPNANLKDITKRLAK